MKQNVWSTDLVYCHSSIEGLHAKENCESDGEVDSMSSNANFNLIAMSKHFALFHISLTIWMTLWLGTNLWCHQHWSVKYINQHQISQNVARNSLLFNTCFHFCQLVTPLSIFHQESTVQDWCRPGKTGKVKMKEAFWTRLLWQRTQHINSLVASCLSIIVRVSVHEIIIIMF